MWIKISLKESLSLGSGSSHLEDLNIAFVVVWHVHLKPVVTIEVSSCKRANCAASLNDDVVGVLKLRRVTCWDKDVSVVVSVSCDEDMGAGVILLGVWTDCVGEPWRHVWHEQVPDILETLSKSELFKCSAHEIIWHSECKDCGLVIVLFMIVDEKLLLAITIQIYK